MPLKVTGTPVRPDLEQDTYPAVCIGVYDLGTVTYKNSKYEPKPTIAFVFEFPDVPDEEGFPKTKHVEFSAGLSPKSNLRKFLVAWRGKEFDDSEIKDFDVRPFLGKPCQIQIVHRAGTGEKSDSVYANIGSIMKPARGQIGPEPSRTPAYFDLADGDPRIPGAVPEDIKAKIVASPEYADLKAGRTAMAAKPAGKQGPPAEVAALVKAVGLSWPYSESDVEDKFDPEKHGGDVEYDALMSLASDAGAPF